MGFAKACNQGLRHSKGNYVLFLNPDTIVLNDALVKSLVFMDSNPNIGVIGCKLLNEDGSLQPSCANFPYIRYILLDHVLRKRLFNDAIKRKFLLRYWAHNEIREVDWMLGAFLMTRRTVMDFLGGFDEGFFLYGEDLDLCFRINETRWKVVFYPQAEVIHIGNSSWETERLERVYNALLRFYRKHFSPRNVHFLRFLMKLIFLLRKEKILFFNS
jgi:GT2 family glycosyltransferase